MSSLTAVPCFSSSLRPEWCIHTPVRRLILPAYPFLSLPLTARCTCATPGCRVALQRTGTWLPTCSMALAQSCCQATVVCTSQHPGLILLCSLTFCSALGSLAPQRYTVHPPGHHHPLRLAVFFGMQPETCRAISSATKSASDSRFFPNYKARRRL